MRPAGDVVIEGRRYDAISEGMLYSAYIHPLSPLTDDEVLSAIAQVAKANITFGTEYSSGALVFGGTATR